MSNFSYVDIHRQDASGVHHPWKRVHVSTVENIIAKVANNNSIFTTIQRYSSPEHEDNEIELCPLCFDFDAVELEDAYRDAVTIVEYFVKGIGLNIAPDSLMVYYSGNRGFHVTVSHTLFGAKPMVDMIKVWRLIAEDYAKQLNLKTMDRAIYSRRRAWRVPNTIHIKTALYKIPLTYEDLMAGIGSIRRKAKQPVTWLNLIEVL